MTTTKIIIQFQIKKKNKLAKISFPAERRRLRHLHKRHHNRRGEFRQRLLPPDGLRKKGASRLHARQPLAALHPCGSRRRHRFRTAAQLRPDSQQRRRGTDRRRLLGRLVEDARDGRRGDFHLNNDDDNCCVIGRGWWWYDNDEFWQVRFYLFDGVLRCDVINYDDYNDNFFRYWFIMSVYCM